MKASRRMTVPVGPMNWMKSDSDMSGGYRVGLGGSGGLAFFLLATIQLGEQDALNQARCAPMLALRQLLYLSLAVHWSLEGNKGGGPAVVLVHGAIYLGLRGYTKYKDIMSLTQGAREKKCLQ